MRHTNPRCRRRLRYRRRGTPALCRTPSPPQRFGSDGRPAAAFGNWMGWRHTAWAAQGLRTFALIYRQQDRQLGPPDVQKIAEAFLLWNGNHSWKVIDVAADHRMAPIGFCWRRRKARSSPASRWTPTLHA